MSRPSVDHYKTLGLPPNASPEQIRRRFRELARKYHPDICPESNAAERFKEINAAHQVLSDPRRRAQYDAERVLAEAHKQARGAEPPAETWHSDEHSRRASETERARTQQSRPEDAAQKIAWLLSEARTCLRRGRYREAHLYANHAIRLDRSCAEAYHILGDIHRARRQTNEALAMYSFVLQLDPTHSEARAKFDKLAGGGVRTTIRNARQQSRGWKWACRASPERLLRMSAVSAGLLAAAACAAWSASPRVVYEWLFLGWPLATLFGLVAAGFSAGAVLAVSDLVDESARELRPSVFAHVARRPNAPIGLVMGLAALVWLPLALALFLLVSAARESLSTSWLRAFGAAALVAVAFGLRSGSPALLVMGGNIAFAGVLAGWMLGDRFRPQPSEERRPTGRSR